MERGLPADKKPVPRKYRARLLELPDVLALRAELKRLEVDPGGIHIMQTKGLGKLVLLSGISPKAANIIKQEALARGGDVAVSRRVADFAPEPTDVLLMGSLTFYKVLVEKLLRQPVYGLSRIGREIDQMLTRAVPGYRGTALQSRRTLDLPGARPLELGQRTYIMGILNLMTTLPHDTLARARQMAASGADMIEIVAAPGEEDKAIPPAIRLLHQELPQTVLSVAVSRAAAAAACLEAGAHLVHTLGQAHQDPEMARVLAATAAPVILTHTGGGTADRDVVANTYEFFCQALEELTAAGSGEEQILLDPGFGRGKSVQEDLLVTRRLREFTSLGRPILYAPRHGQTLERVLPGVTAPAAGALAAAAVGNGADIVQSEDVTEMAGLIRMTDALVRGYAGPDE